MYDPSIHSQRQITSIGVYPGHEPQRIEVPRSARVIACERCNSSMMITVWLESLSTSDNCYVTESITIVALPSYAAIPAGFAIVGMVPGDDQVPTRFVGIKQP